MDAQHYVLLNFHRVSLALLRELSGPSDPGGPGDLDGGPNRPLWACSNITDPKISEETFLTKVLHCSVLNHIYQHEITEITCWTELFFI